MRILVTGATGFVGSHVARKLCQLGHDLVLLKRPASDCWRIVDILPQIKILDWNGREPSEVFKKYADIQAVIHTATCYGRSGERRTDLLEANIMAPLRLLEAASISGAKVFLNTDTFFNTEGVLYEHLSGYTLSKRQFVEWGRQLAVPLKMTFANLKLFHVYGPQDGSEKFSTQIISSCLKNVPAVPLTAGEQKRDFIFIQDVVDAFVQALNWSEIAECGFMEFEAGTGQEHTIREFVETVHRLSNSRTQLQFGALPYRANEFRFSPAKPERLGTLGWRPKWSLEDGLAATVESMHKAKGVVRA